MSKKRNVPAHGRKAARSRRPRKRRFLVVAGGAVTEKQYFKQLESLYDVIIDYQQKNNSPKQLAKLAVKLKREDKRDTSTDCYERIWVVVDVDDFHDHGEAARICNDNGIELIISNPCFEVWLDAAIRNAARHNTTENRQGRNRLAPNHEQEYAPWTDMPKVIETLKSNKQS